MPTPTFSQKIRLTRPGWGTLLTVWAMFIGLSASRSALGQSVSFYDDAVSFTLQPTNGVTTSQTYAGRAYSGDTPYTSYPLLGTTATTSQPTPNLGTYDVNSPPTSQLLFTGGSIVADPPLTRQGFTGTIVAARILYRLYLNTSISKPSYSQLPLVDTGTGAPRSGAELYSNTTSIDLLSGLPGGGTYVFETIFQVDSQDNATGKVTTYNDPSSFYQVNFTVAPPTITPPGGSTTWISNSSDATGVDWLNPNNWSNGVPNRFSNAFVPDKTSDTSTPLLSDPNANYEVRTLTLSGSANSTRALVRIGQSITGGSPTGATLKVYGDLNCDAGGILAAVSGTNSAANPATNSTLVLARNDGGAQAVRGSKISIADIRVEGRGIKAVVATELAAPNTLTLAPDPAGPGLILRTAADRATRDANNNPTDNAPDSAFPLSTTQSSSINLKDSGTLFGETLTSYIQGILIADRPMRAGQKQTFGNIGLDITPSRDILPPNVVVTRTVGDPLRGPVANTRGPSAPGAPQPVKRQYGVSGDVNNNTTSTITFHYLNSTDELNGIPENNLTIFKTANNAPPFFLVGRTGTVDLVNHTVTREAYSGSLNTLTLGDEFNPLPVKLTAFNATRSGVNALVSWTTASETNNKGFEVQVSTDAKSFHTLGFVASQASNSVQNLTYRYTDTEAGKIGIRYYRLHQIDLNGRDAYSPVTAVNFDASVTSSGLLTYPNPFSSSDNVMLSITGAQSGIMTQVKLLDATGRTVRAQRLPLNATGVSLGDLSDLHSGMYIVRVTLPDGSTQTARMQKQ